MNSEAEIHQAIDDFNSGRFAVIAPGDNPDKNKAPYGVYSEKLCILSSE